MLAKRLDDQWFELRLTQLGLGSSASHLGYLDDKQSEGPRFSEAVEFYLQLKAKDKDEVFTRTAKRNRDYLISVLGDKPVDQYTSKDRCYPTIPQVHSSLDMMFREKSRSNIPNAHN